MKAVGCCGMKEFQLTSVIFAGSVLPLVLFFAQSLNCLIFLFDAHTISAQVVLALLFCC